VTVVGIPFDILGCPG